MSSLTNPFGHPTDDDVRILASRMALIVVSPSWGSDAAQSQGKPSTLPQEFADDEAQAYGDLVQSIRTLPIPPALVIVVDGMGSDRMRALVEADDSQRRTAPERPAAHDAPAADTSGDMQDRPRFVYVKGDAKQGPSQWLSLGMKEANDRGAQWFWLLDTAVTVNADALHRFAAWTSSHALIQGGFDEAHTGAYAAHGSYTQFHPALGISEYVRAPRFGRAGYLVISSASARGMLVSRAIVDAIGLPDPRFALHGADTMYTYAAGAYTNPIAIPDAVVTWNSSAHSVQKEAVNICSNPAHANITTADCYVTMRNRGYVARYLMERGDFHPLAFAIGTAVTCGSQFSALMRARHDAAVPGIVELFKGWVAARRIIHDPDWRPAQPPSALAVHSS